MCTDLRHLAGGCDPVGRVGGGERQGVQAVEVPPAAAVDLRAAV